MSMSLSHTISQARFRPSSPSVQRHAPNVSVTQLVLYLPFMRAYSSMAPCVHRTFHTCDSTP